MGLPFDDENDEDELAKQEKSESVKQTILERYRAMNDPAEDERINNDAASRRQTTHFIEGFEQFGRAASTARGNHGGDPSFYEGVRGSIDKEAQDKRAKRKNETERLMTEDRLGWQEKERGHQEDQWGFGKEKQGRERDEWARNDVQRKDEDDPNSMKSRVTASRLKRLRPDLDVAGMSYTQMKDLVQGAKEDHEFDERAKDRATARATAAGRETFSSEPYVAEDGTTRIGKWSNRNGLVKSASDPKAPRHGSDPELKQATAEQIGSASFGRRAQDSSAIVDELESKGYKATSRWRGVRNAIPGNLATNPLDESYEQAQREFIASILRKESGGAITDQEFQEYGKIYFPQPGQGPEIVAQKRAARKRASESLIEQAGQKAAAQITNKPFTPPGEKPGAGTAYAAPGSEASPADLQEAMRLKANPPPDVDAKIDAFMRKNGIVDRNEAIKILKESGRL